MSGLLEVERLAVAVPAEGELQTVVADVSFTVSSGEAVGLVGESGSGKSMTAKSNTRPRMLNRRWTPAAVTRCVSSGSSGRASSARFWFPRKIVSALSSNCLSSFSADSITSAIV